MPDYFMLYLRYNYLAEEYETALRQIVDYVPTTETHDYEVVISLKRIANDVLNKPKGANSCQSK